MPSPFNKTTIASQEDRTIRVLQDELKELVTESRPFVLYRAAHRGRKILVSLLKAENFSPSDIARLLDACKKLEDIDSDVLLSASNVAVTDSGYGLVLEYSNAIPLPAFRCCSPLDIDTFLVIAVQLAAGLDALHRSGIFHGTLRPADILVDPQTKDVKVWNLSCFLNDAKQPEPSEESDLLYISPEQTGLIKNQTDHRSDLYSLGVIFYELLVNEVPFRSSDLKKILESHAVQEPLNPNEVNAAVPFVVSDIIMKLLSKNPKVRYQNAAGLRADLQKCLDDWKKQGRIERFRLASTELLPLFTVPQKLYGREQEIKELTAAFLRVKHGRSEAFFLSGNPGVGKTSLIHEVRKHVIAEHGYFVEGKFDQLKKDVPYSAFREAFGGLARQLLTESNERIQRWNECVRNALGSNGQVIINVIPEIERIIGKQPSVSYTDATESQNRFTRVMQKFVSAFADQDHPFVLFLDDLQWVDLASLQLIKSLVTDPDSKHLLLFGAYRDNEVGMNHPFKHMVADLSKTGLSITATNIPPLQIEDVNSLIADLIISASDEPRPSHPLPLMIDDLIKQGASITDASLPPLKIDEVNTFIARSLNCSLEKAEPLARLVHQKTSGNPFFIRQMLQALSEERILINQTGTGWQWNLERIERLPEANTVVQLLVSKIQKLCADTQRVLKLASCIGNKFDLETLAAVYGKPVGITYVDLSQAIRETLVVPLNAEYAFYHDRIQEAAYSLLLDAERKETHAKIGYLLLTKTKPESISQKIFTIVDQLNSGVETITTLEKRIELAELNLTAGRKAKTTTAFSAAAVYFSKGIALLPQGSWQLLYELTLALHMECSECLYLSGDFEGAEKLFSVILGNARTNRDKAEVYRIWVMLSQNKGTPRDSLKYGKEGLRLLNINIHLNPSKLTVLKELLMIKWYLRKQKKEALAFLPKAADAGKLITPDILVNMAPAAYYCNKTVLSILLLKIFSFSLRHGHTYAAPLGYASYGFIIGAAFNDYKTGHLFAKIGVELSVQGNNLSMKSQCLSFFGIFINHWTQPLKTSIDLVLQGYALGLESGNFSYASYCAGTHICTKLFKGDSLDQTLQQAEKYLPVLEQLKLEDMFLGSTAIRRTILALKGLTENPSSLSDHSFREREFAEKLMIDDMGFVQAIYYNWKLLLFYLFDQMNNTLHICTELEKKCNVTLGTFYVAHHNLYHSLTLAALYPSVNPLRKALFWGRLKKNQKKMKIWANNCPENFLNKHTLVAAEMARVRGKISKAAKLYNEAIALSKQNEFLQEEAIANELAGKFYLSQNDEEKAKNYLQEARACYERWGASAKVKQLEETYVTLFNPASAVV